MSQNLFAVFPLPVMLALAALVVLLLAVLRVLAGMSKPAPVRLPAGPREAAAQRHGLVQTLPERIPAEDGVAIDPDAGHPDREAGLMRI